MIDQTLADSVKRALFAFKKTVIDDPLKHGLTKGEALWMEELSKVYLAKELDIPIPNESTKEFADAMARVTAFGDSSALVTRIYVFSLNLVIEPDFFTNMSHYLSTLERHYQHWGQKLLDISHATQSIEDFMTEYFNDPENVNPQESEYYIAWYFKHFYKFLYDFVLSYTQTGSEVFYGRANH